MNTIKDILRGIVIGIANVIPGVSGGTMMVSMGIYDKLISSITNLFRNFTKSVKTLLPYAVGMGIGIVGLAFSIEFLFDRFPFQTAMLFIGLILGGVPVIIKKVRGRSPEPLGIVLFIIFFALIIAIQFLNGSKDTGGTITLNVVTVIQLFIVGIVASATMMIPGVSGSMILMALGYYTSIIECISGFVKAALALEISKALNYAGVLIPFGLGVLAGIFAIAKLIEVLLKKFERLTYFAILGLVCASPIAVLFGIGINNISAFIILTGLVTFAIGFAIAYLLAVEKKRE